MIMKSFETLIKCHIEVNDYICEKEARLKDFIASKIELLEKTKTNIVLPFFSAYERKKIHTYVIESGKTHISTKSI